MTASARRRVLIVNAYFDPWRSAAPTRLFVPRAMAPYYLAGSFHRDRVAMRVHDEVYHGALVDPKRFAWPDLVVFGGLTAAFDRARQLAAYFRHANPSVVTVIGGPIARALPQLCAGVFDYVCQGDVDSIGGVIDAVFGPGHRAESETPRLDLVGSSFGLGFIETTKYCNFACAFCSLTGEGRPYAAHSEDSINRQIAAMGRVHGVMVLDNNFYGNNRASFEARVRLLGEHWRRGAFRGWGALVTGDFFKRRENIAFVAEHGCLGLFSGVESLDAAVLKAFNKRQSLASDPKSLGDACAAHGIMFEYGMMLDFAQQTTDQIAGQLDRLLADVTVPLPSLLSLTIPIPGTPYFDQAVQTGRLMPSVRLSDLDGQKLVEWPREPLQRVIPFVRDVLQFRGRKRALLRHVIGHALDRRDRYAADQLVVAVLGPLLRYGHRPRIGSVRQMLQTWREPQPTYCAMTDPLPRAYRPLYRLPSRFAADFEPVYVTDARGQLTDAMAAQRVRRPLSA